MSTSTTPAKPSTLTSRSGPSTPIHAIASSLSTRAAPSVPPPSQAYEPLVKAVFRHRLRFILLASALSSWIINSVWGWWQYGGMSRLGLFGTFALPLKPWVLFSTILTWIAVALPISVLRKTFLTACRSSATSPLLIIKEALVQQKTKVTMAACSFSAISALVIHIVMVYSCESQSESYTDPKLSLFVKSKKHPHYLNGRLLFLILTQICTALSFTLRGAMVNRFVFKWSLVSEHSKKPFAFELLMSACVAVVFAVFGLTLASLAFSTLRLGLPILYKIPFLPLVLRPFTAHFLKGSWTILLLGQNLSLLFRAWFLAFSTLLNWEIVSTLFDRTISETTPIAMLSVNPDITLVSGLAASDRIFQFFAFLELRDLAVDESTSASARRTKLFGDQQSTVNLWSFLSRETLAVLAEDHQTFLRRGKPKPQVVALPQPRAVIIPSPTIATPTPLLRQRIFKASPESPGRAALDALASDGPIAKAIDISADATHVPELFRSVETKVVSPITEETKKSVQTATSIGGQSKAKILALSTKIWTHMPENVKHVCGQTLDWLTLTRDSKVVEASLPFREMDIVVIEALSRLTSASLTEDRYGVVQRDIPKILEAMMTFLSDIEQYQGELIAQVQPLPPTASAQEVEGQQTKVAEIQKALELLGQVGDGLKEGALRIVTTFGDKLLAFKFPPKIANKLQAYLDYS